MEFISSPMLMGPPLSQGFGLMKIVFVTKTIQFKILTLDDHLYIGNQRQHGSESMSNGDQSMKRFYQKFFRHQTI